MAWPVSSTSSNGSPPQTPQTLLVSTPAGMVPWGGSSGANQAPGSPAGDDDGFQLGKIFKVLQRRRRVFIAVFLLVSAASTTWLAYQRLMRPVYQGSFRMLIVDPISPTTGGSSAGEGVEGAIGAVALNRSRQDLPTLIRVLESPVVLKPVVSQLQQTWPGQPIPRIQIMRDPGKPGEDPANGVLKVEVSGRDQSQLRRSLELLETSYLGWSLQQRRERLQEAVRFLDEQAPDLERKASVLRGEVQAFRLQHRLLMPETEAATTRGQVDALRNQLIAQQAELSRLERLRGDVASGRLVTSDFSSQSNDGSGASNGSGGTSVSLTVPNQAELAELAKLDGQLAEARSRFVPGTPLLTQLERARASLIPRIQRKQLEAISAALSQYQSGIQTTQRQIALLEGRFDGQPALLRQFGVLEQKLQMAESNLTSYQRAREQFQLEIAQNTAPWKVISPGDVGSTPVEPALGRGLMRALLLGLAAGAGAALLRERFDHVFHTPGEVRDDLGESLLGHVPYISLFEGVRQDKRFMLEELDNPRASGSAAYQRFHYQEAFRNLATSLRFLNSDQPLRSIALSSSLPSEGKSLVVILLAKTLSELGQRVLLVDADMRKPQLHHRLGLDNLSGLSNLLTDELADWQSVVHQVPGHTSWDVITAGRTPPDPPRLLSSQRMGQLVSNIADSGGYDLVIYDTPPALGLADAALVAEQLDGLIVLVSLGKVDRDLPKEAIRRIRQAGAPVLGVVTNARNTGGDTEDQVYGFGYRYRYGYGKGGYGYVGYGYGGYANDPAIAYMYYRKKKAPAGDMTAPSSDAGVGTPGNAQPSAGGNGKGQSGKLAALLPNRSNLRRIRRSIIRWLDG